MLNINLPMVDALITKGLNKSYANHVALSDMSLNIPRQSIYGLLGPNGAGKTTLIRIINQIINSDGGEIFIFGEKLEPRHVALIGYLPEERGLYKKTKIGEQLTFLAELKGLSRNEARKRILIWFEKFAITDWLHKKVEDLSKGMAQKVQFISTVLHEPKLLILDEPFSGFDPVNVELVTQHILDLREKGSTIIFSTHRMESVEALCDHLALINKSKKILEGSKSDVKAQFRSSIYVVEHENPFTLPEGFSIQQSHKEERRQTFIEAPPTARSNDLLRLLIDQTEVYSFQEKNPSISDIFINLVKEVKA